MRQSSVSVGLVVRNEAHQIQDLLHQIRDICGDDIHEIVVVDNASTDLTLDVVQGWRQAYPDMNLRLLQCPQNNMAVARNHLLAGCSGDWVYFIDADCRLQKDSWKNLMTALARYHAEAQVAALGGGNVPLDHEGFINHGLKGMAAHWWGHMNSIQVKPPENLQHVDFLSSCNLLVRRHAALECGGCDPRFDRAGEDLSLCHRLRRANKRLVAVPQVEVFHLQNQSLWSWFRKPFSYGRAQVEVALRYPGHFRGWRGLQAAFLTAFLMSFFFWGWRPLLLPLVYLLLLLLTGLKPSQAFFLILTQGLYALGEVYALLTFPFSFLYLPMKMPILDKE